jgi:hypothetical protein
MLGSNDRRSLPATVLTGSPPLDRINAKYTNRLPLANGIFRSAQSERLQISPLFHPTHLVPGSAELQRSIEKKPKQEIIA